MMNLFKNGLKIQSDKILELALYSVVLVLGLAVGGLVVNINIFNLEIDEVLNVFFTFAVLTFTAINP